MHPGILNSCTHIYKQTFTHTLKSKHANRKTHYDKHKSREVNSREVERIQKIRDKRQLGDELSSGVACEFVSETELFSASAAVMVGDID